MKEYLVVSDYSQWNNMWIVSARNEKYAIELVYKTYIVPMNKVIKRKNKNIIVVVEKMNYMQIVLGFFISEREKLL